MKAYYNSNQSPGLELIDLPEPEIRDPNDVKIKVHYATLGPEDMRTGNTLDFYSREGIICIEMAGIIVDAGPQAKLDGFDLGDPVTGIPFRFCGACRPCRSGRRNCCVNPVFSGGTLCEYIVWKSSQLAKLNDRLSLRTGSLIASVAEGLEAMERGKVGVYSRIAIWGGNYMGMILTQLARRFGAQEIVVIDDLKHREKDLIAMGATHVLHPDDRNFELNMHRYTDFSGFDTIFECSGLSESLNRSLNHLVRGGSVVLMTSYDRSISMQIDAPSFYSGNYTISSVFTSNAKLDAAVQLASSLKLDSLISFELPFRAVPQAFSRYDAQKHHKVAIQVVI